MSVQTSRLRLLDPVADRQRPSWAAVAIGIVAGLVMAVLWSAQFVDTVIGRSVADNLLGHDAQATAISGSAAGLLFAFVSGLAGTFTACNIAVAATIGPISQSAAGRPGAAAGLRALVRPAVTLMLSMVAVSATYGFVGVLLGDRLPQLSTAVTDSGIPVRLIQSSVVFGLVGLAMIWLGLASAGVVPDLFARRPTARVIVLGVLVGAFLIGRPYPLFNKLFHWAADSHNPWFGAGAFVLQSLGNVTLVLLVLSLAIVLSRGRLIAALARHPRRVAVVSAVLFVALGVFSVVYWDVRLPAIFGIGWFPMMPYNS